MSIALFGVFRDGVGHVVDLLLHVQVGVGVAPGNGKKSGASRNVLVSGLRPVILCVPRPPCGPRRCAALALRWVPIRPQGAPSAQRQIRHAHLKKKMQQALRACVA